MKHNQHVAHLWASCMSAARRACSRKKRAYDTREACKALDGPQPPFGHAPRSVVAASAGVTGVHVQCSCATAAMDDRPQRAHTARPGTSERSARQTRSPWLDDPSGQAP